MKKNNLRALTPFVTYVAKKVNFYSSIEQHAQFHESTRARQLLTDEW